MTDKVHHSQCPGCGHHYGRIMSSTPNEHGYCHWCRQEGVFDDASAKASNEKWARYHAEQEHQREEEHQRRMAEEEECYWLSMGY